MNRKVADFLVFRDRYEGKLLDHDNLDFSIPPIYHSFLSVFVGIRCDELLDNSIGLKKPLNYYEFHKEDGEDLFFQNFIPIEESLMGYLNSEFWMDSKVIPISNHDHGGNLVLGCGSGNMDMIYFDYSNGLEFIANNIYHFLMKLNFTEHPEYKGLKPYKNWYEDFWRH